MADYPQDRMPPPRPSQYGHSNNYQRDAAFSNIFGAAPPPGRSQTMTSSIGPPQLMHEGRTQTMSSTTSGMQRPPPLRSPPGGGAGGGGGGSGGYGEVASPRHRPVDGGMSNGYYQGQQRSVSGGQQVPSPQYLQQQQQQQQQARRPYPGLPPTQQQAPPRSDSMRGPPPPQGYYNNAPPPRTSAQRFYQGGPAPALNSDAYRSQSLASTPRQATYQPPPQSYQPQPPANSFRHAQYNPPSARTTAQGRIVPERHLDDRTMSLTGGYNSHDRDTHTHQTMSGRVIPSRRLPGTSPTAPDHATPGHAHGSSISSFPNGYAPPPPGTQTRTTSMVSSTGNDSIRTMSMASTIAPSMTAASERSDALTLTHRPSASGSVPGERPPTAKIRAPIVYPAMLSRVAECFRQKIIVGDRTKNELTYKNAFSGAEAVDVLSYIIRTTDRNLALLLGRALDAQKFFHDVTYEHRLRDSTSEMYQFRETLQDEDEAKPAVNGVFVLLSECYSPTCTRDQLCYSIACPRRLEQVSRLNLKMGPGLKREGEATVNDDDVDQTDEQKLWINSVPKEIADSISEREKKRQEVISEICYTERDFVKDLEYLRDFWILPLRGKINGMSAIPPPRRERVVRTIFSNIIDPPSIHGVSSRFAKALTERQQKNPVVGTVGDIFLEFVPQFEPFILYGSKQLEGKFEFENERSINKDFSRFVDEVERRRESRKLELNGYLTKPTTRLARYPLLLENVLKYTEGDSSDKTDIPKVLTMIRDLLGRVNAESGKAENRFNLRRLHEQLRFRPNEKVDLKLTDDGREMVYKSQLKKSPTEAADITAFLFDHAVLLVKVKQAGKAEELKAYRRPIPLELLSIKEMAEVIPQSGAVKRSSSSLLPTLRTSSNDTKKGDGWPITFRHLGKNGYELTLYANNQSGRQKWLEYIDTAQQRLRARADFLNTTVISCGFFSGQNKVNCVAPFGKRCEEPPYGLKLLTRISPLLDGGRKLIYGTDNGIYVSDRKSKDKDAPPKRVIDVQSVTQVDVLEEYQLLLVLSNRSLHSFSLAALDPNEPISSKRGKKIQSHCNFFKTGICLGRHLVCCVKSSALSTTIKVYEPNDAMSRTKKQKGLSKMFNAGQDELKPFKEFYIPTESSSVHFLKSKLCVACARGFEVVSLETLETQSLLDQADTSLDFVARKEGVKPIHIERLNGEFLLNYSEFSFFVNRNGWRARPEWRLDWEGTPQAFALQYPWILAFEPSFIELRHIDNLSVHIVPHKNIRMLHSSTHEILFAYEDERGEDVIEAIDFWKSQRKSEYHAAPSSSPSVGPSRIGQ
ncbi:CNH domain-containing protein [Diplogelasinospora grovesii]|uniref:CNH domain-containing protein n=1 Tax=Diplogelasinospora grovesii TaxID=303347 RepID=A0AAN6NC91_9PEZI|nr:CNH domain-containing protein [Diplogelasinospora grovesii]